MNKYGFLSGILTLILLILQFIPLGIYFGFTGDNFCTWLTQLIGITKNPISNSLIKIPVDIYNQDGTQVFLWGIIRDGTLHNWLFIHMLTFIFLFVIGLITCLLALIGSGKDNDKGKKLMKGNSVLVIIIFLYVLVGIPIYSKEILGVQLDTLDIIVNIFHHDNYGLYILIIDLTLAIIAVKKHPIEE